MSGLNQEAIERGKRLEQIIIRRHNLTESEQNYVFGYSGSDSTVEQRINEVLSKRGTAEEDNK
ncbi:hypothetical protein [Allocoleopsis sp.]|uniref:hypothetical protein n=1 Tax=Allocoleopsis sp. TaxID=3088169 RepID=UPI002FCFE3B6